MVDYNKTNWVAGAKITSASLNNIENGIYAVATAANTINDKVTALGNTLDNLNTSIDTTNNKLDTLTATLDGIDFDDILDRLNAAAAAIQTNAENIATNAGNISTNATGIADNKNRIDELEENQFEGNPISEEDIRNLFRDDKTEENS
jgi:ribosomal protein L12E/L44/L45/RPP1/RPP2